VGKLKRQEHVVSVFRYLIVLCSFVLEVGVPYYELYVILCNSTGLPLLARTEKKSKSRSAILKMILISMTSFGISILRTL